MTASTASIRTREASQLEFAQTIWRRNTVQAETGYSRSTIYLRIAQGMWTKPVSLGAPPCQYDLRHLPLRNQ